MNLLKLLSEVKVTEDTGAGAVAGFSAPMGDKNSIVKKKMDEDDKSSIDSGVKEFEGKNFKISKTYRGPSKGITIMISQRSGNGDFFGADHRVQQILNYIESII